MDTLFQLKIAMDNLTYLDHLMLWVGMITSISLSFSIRKFITKKEEQSIGIFEGMLYGAIGTAIWWFILLSATEKYKILLTILCIPIYVLSIFYC